MKLPIVSHKHTKESFTMDEYESLSHSKWECKYHVVFIPKCRSRTLHGELRPHLGDVFRNLALQKESQVEEGHLMPDHVNMMISIHQNTRSRRWWIYQGQERSIWPVSTARRRGAIL
jgi:REP element-mobilizing transposase RayT